MKDTCHRVARITKELKALSSQFQWSAFEDSSPDEQAQILEELLNGSLVEDLRATVDYLSQFFWSYIESAAEGSSQEESYVDCELQNLRLLRITEMLRILHRSARPTQDPLAFVDRVTESVDRYLQAADDDLMCEQGIGDITSSPARGHLAKGKGRIISGSSLLDS
jgi:hypothetical protein